MYPSVDRPIERARVIRPSHILVATNLDDLERLTPHIVAQARASGSLVTLVHAAKPIECRAMDTPVCSQACKRGERKAEQVLKAKAEELEGYGVPCTYVVLRGQTREILLEQIMITGATRLIMGCHGRGDFGQFLMGSVVNAMLGLCPIPVFVVPPHCKVGKSFCQPQQILHPVSLREGYKATAMAAMELANSCSADLSLLHVCAGGQSAGLTSSPGLGFGLLGEIARDRRGVSAPTRTITRSGDLVQAIVKEADECDADWIVMGVRPNSRTWPAHETLAYRVASAAHSPVLALWQPAAVRESRPEEAVALVAEYPMLPCF